MRSWINKAAAGAVVIAAVGFAIAAGSGARAAEAVRLFNGKNFDGWYVWIEKGPKNTDPDGVFKIEDGGVIHVSGARFGYLGTEKEYDNYKLSLEFKWGEKRYPPRETAKRDAGVLYHAVGDDKVWMKSLECQIQEGDCGDMYLTAGKDGSKPALTVKEKRYVGGHVVRFADYEKPRGEWNKVEIVCKGGMIQHYINGMLNMEGTEAEPSRGKINLQSEGAEIYYRNITLEPLQ